MSKQKEHQIKKIRKTRLWPILLITLFSCAILFTTAISALAFLLTNTLQSKLDSTAAMVKKCNSYIESLFLDGLDDAKTYSSVISTKLTENPDPTQLRDTLKLMNQVNSYEDIGIIKLDNSIISACGTLKSVEELDMLDQTIENGSGIFFEEKIGSNLIYFTSPISVNGEVIGILYLTSNDHIGSQNSTESVFNMNNTYYILDDQNRVIAYLGNSSNDFDYNAIKEQGFVSTGDYNLNIADIFDPHSNTNLVTPSASDMDPSNLSDTKVESYIRNNGFFTDDGYISLGLWYENNLSTNNWKTVSYQSVVFDTFSVDDLKTLAALFSVILLSPFVLIFILSIAHFSTNKRLRKALYLDPSTGGHNFLYFKAEAHKLLRKRKKLTTDYYIVSLSLDKYKVFCDMYGHRQSEELLETIYQTLNTKLDRKERMARHVEAQYTLLLHATDANTLEARVKEIMISLSSLFAGEKLTYTAGIFQIEDRFMSVERMNNFAIVARDTILPNQKHKIGWFSKALRDEMIREKELENLMEKALREREFQVYLQPKYKIPDNHLSGAEALVRWVSPEKGFISPGDFIPLFEKNGFIVRLDDFMLHEVAKLQKKWLDAQKEVVPISVNVSRLHFKDPKLAEHILGIVDAYEIPHSLIELEMTESAFFDDKDMLLETVNKLQSYGFMVSMDDFGSGYSSLNSLMDLPLDIVKLDGGFFRDTDNLERSQIVIKDTISMAKNLNMKIVAEGIETKDQVDFLQSIGCDMIQGYYFAKPMPITDFEGL